MDTNQKLEIARNAVHNKEYTTLAKLVVENQVGGDSVVCDYVLSHENGLFVLQDKFWLQFEKELLRLENLEVPNIQFHKEFARQYIKYGADIIDNNEELSWRLWLCLWIARFNSFEQLTTTLSFIMEKNSVGSIIYRHNHWHWILPTNFIMEGTIRHCVFCARSVDSNTRAYGDWRAWNLPQPLGLNDEYQAVTVRTLVQMLQQVFVRPPDRIMRLLDMPRFTTPIGTEV